MRTKTKAIMLVISLLWAVGLLFILHGYSQNGRYAMQLRGVEELDVLDTRTGKAYLYSWELDHWAASKDTPNKPADK